jgi:threonine/homoserine/homoserine lactone efflux protein
VSSFIATPGAFALFVVVACITPGPNNLMLLAVGLSRGTAASVRTALGVSVGWGIQVLLCGLGLGAIIHSVPGLARTIEVLGIVYLCWLAWRLFGATDLGEPAPMMGFSGAVAFQWVNPKALSMSLTTAGLFLVHGGPHPSWVSAVAVALGAILLSLPCALTWGLAGSLLSTTLSHPAAIRRFNVLAGVALLAVVMWLVVTTG